MTKEMLNDVFEYYDGKLFWKKKTAPCIRIGDRVGTLRESGYRVLTLYKKYHMEHRVIWMFHYGDIPKGYEIDHIDEVKDNNKIENLRLATPSENQYNVSATKHSKTGLKGAAFHKRDKKWFASIRHNGKRIYLGYYNSPEQAHQAYKKAAIELHGEFANY
jgi:hypothetical protein